MKKYLLGILLFLLLILSTGCKKNIIGKWKSLDKKNEYYYIFNADKSCSYEMTFARLDCTYEIEGNKLIILYKGSEKAKTYEYKFKDDTLIIKDDTGNDNKFVKIKRTLENK